jgi:transposase-like protein
VDETYLRVAGRWTYFYRAVDSAGATIHFYLSGRRDATAANIPSAKLWRIRHMLARARSTWTTVISEGGRNCRRSTNWEAAADVALADLNNIIEQDHRAAKRRVNTKQGFRSFTGAWRTIQGYQALHMIRKGQVRWLPKGNIAAQVLIIDQGRIRNCPASRPKRSVPKLQGIGTAKDAEFRHW